MSDEKFPNIRSLGVGINPAKLVHPNLSVVGAMELEVALMSVEKLQQELAEVRADYLLLERIQMDICAQRDELEACAERMVKTLREISNIEVEEGHPDTEEPDYYLTVQVTRNLANRALQDYKRTKGEG